jgi:hypothetical protein
MARRNSHGALVLLAACTCLLVGSAEAEAPYRFFDWEITYGDISPLGVPQQVQTFVSCFNLPFPLFLICRFLFVVVYRSVDAFVFLQGILINGQFPGPEIDCQTNDNLIINVRNSLPDEPFLLSWYDQPSTLFPRRSALCQFRSVALLPPLGVLDRCRAAMSRSPEFA